MERSDAARVLREGLTEMLEGGGCGTCVREMGRRSDAGEVAADVTTLLVPAPDPAVCGGERAREGTLSPSAVNGLTTGVSGDQAEKVCGGKRGVGDQVAPKDGKGAPAAFIAVAIRAKKRSLRTSRAWPVAAYPREKP